MNELVIYTDGACKGNPGPGGWGALLRSADGTEKELCGGELGTTNNRMEMMAAIKALESLKRDCDVKLYSDSVYLKDGLTKWLDAWKARGWKTADKKPVKNKDLWEILDVLIQTHKVEMIWIKGHAGHPENERADALARKGIDSLR